MKQKFLFFAALAALVAGLTACNKQETPASGDSQKQGFVMENVVVDITLSQDNAKASITLNDIRFSEQMPLLITLRIPDVPVTRQGESIRFNWNDTENAITPIAIVRGQETAYVAHLAPPVLRSTTSGTAQSNRTRRMVRKRSATFPPLPLSEPTRKNRRTSPPPFKATYWTAYVSKVPSGWNK